ncbi:hypothetical protein EC844_11098 [Acinetobacter calcoaceticus]|uniref:Uncharacterized protein n=1 Tax=Acinetobacter calcoaceticus TaxID=471 RepID=A0A4R1XRT1_ACICA|nr:hypothetical protein EC844_11098 [Acinetobacter calcoaceticus]
MTFLLFVSALGTTTNAEMYALIDVEREYVNSDSSFKEKQGSDEMIDFNTIVFDYLKNYDPVLEPWISRPGNALSTIYIKKSRLPKSEMNIILRKLKLNGWREFENFGNYSEYCLNENQVISILYPTKTNEFSKSGIPIDYKDITSWSIGLYYNKNGVSGCEI